MQLPLITVNGNLPDQEGSLEVAQREHLSKLLTKSNFFRELAPSVQAKLPEIAQCASKPQGSVIFRQGDAGLHCYVILSGKVGVWIASSGCNREQDEDEEEDDASEELSTQVPSSRSTVSACSSPDCAESARNSLCSEKHAAQIASTRSSPRNSSNLIERREYVASVSPSSSSLPKLDKEQSLCKLDLEHLRAEKDFELDFGNKVATLGPGSIFGELALLHEQPRNATITCSEDCEFIIIKKEDFNALLKQEIQRAKKEKIDFLQEHCHGCKKLSALRARKVNAVMYAFEKITVPKGHTFFKQDSVSPVGVYLVSSGSVELRSKTPATLRAPAAYKSLGVLLKGAAFGSPVPGMPETFSAVAASSCEVYHSTGGSFLRLPRSLQQAIQANLIETMSTRMQISSPAMSFVVDSCSASTPCVSRPFSAPRNRPLSACSSLPSTPSGSRPLCACSTSTPFRTRPLSACGELARICPLSGRQHTSSQSNAILSTSELCAELFLTPPRANHAEKGSRAADSSSQTYNSQEQISRSGVVARTRSMVADSRLPRSSSVPTELKRTNRNQQPQGGRNTISRSTHAALRRKSSLRQFPDDLAMERCKAFGGHRLRAVRNSSSGASAPSLVNTMNSFKN